jgi:hypothetical protein
MTVRDSNAGDRYHFVYAARRLMELLRPAARLRRVEVEGVAAGDAADTDPDAFLGVDLTEYYGGDSLADAEAADIVQVKYSPKHPTQPWTLSRLTKRRKGGVETSVLGKLAAGFVALRAQGSSASLSVSIVTNQPLDGDDRERFVRAKASVRAAAGFSALSEQDQEWVERLRAGTGLEGEAFAAFLDALNLDGFGGLGLSAAEGRLFEELDRFIANADIHVDGLIAYVQEHALPNRPSSITKTDVLRQLRLSEEDFSPAPPDLDPPEMLFATADVAAVAAAVRDSRTAIVIAHGLAGVGKTSALQLLARDFAGEFDVVIFDCFGGGAGLELGTERFPYRKFFTQLTNDIDAARSTGVFATTRLDRDRLIRQFTRALEAAAGASVASGRTLVIGIDAVDNAVAAAQLDPLQQNESFVPLLPRLRVPKGCVVVCTARTENLGTLPLDDAAKVELHGFTREETHRHARLTVPTLSDADADLLHERTRGTARVQARILELLATTGGADARALIEQYARESAFAYYREHSPGRLTAAADRHALAVLIEATQPLDLSTWARLATRHAQELEALRHSLAFGLRADGDRVVWRDQEFWDFLREHLAGDLPDARRTLADFCAREIGTSPYARANFSRHLYAAGDFDALVDHWLKEDRLEQEIRATNPHDEVIGRDLGYTLLAAQERHRRADALRLLTLAADVAQGRNMFTDAAARFADVTVAEQFEERVLGSLRSAEQTSGVAHAYLRFAAAFGRALKEREVAWDLAQRAKAILQQERRAHGSGFDLDDVRNLAIAEATFGGLEDALEGLGEWTPPEAVASVYYDVIAAHVTNDNAASVVAALPSIDDLGRRFASLALLSRADVLPAGTDVVQLARDVAVAPFEYRRFDRPSPVDSVLDAIEVLLKNGYRDAAKVLLDVAAPSAPTLWHDPELAGYVRYFALREVITGETFDAATYGKQGTGTAQTYRDVEMERVRKTLQRLYPAALARARAAAGSSTDLPAEILRALTPYEKREYRREPTRTDVSTAAADLFTAVMMVPERKPDIVTAIRATVDRELANPAHRNYARFASILVRDTRYHREAEDMLRYALANVRPPLTRATDAVDDLLTAHDAARKIDARLAHELFETARDLASSIDATIDARAAGLLGIGRSVLDGGGTLTIDQMNQLAAVVEYEADMDDETPVVRMEDTLRLIARAQPGTAVNLARSWDRDAKLDLVLALPSVARGIGERRDADAAMLIPVAALARDSERAMTFAQQVGELTTDGSANARRVVAAWAAYVRRLPGKSRFEATASLVVWATAHACADTPEVHALADDLAAAQAAGLRMDREEDAHLELSMDADKLLAKVEALLPTSPLDALAELEAIAGKIFGRAEKMQGILAALAGALPSAQCARILNVIIEWGDAVYRAGEAFPLLATVQRASMAGTADAVRSASITLLRPEVVATLPHFYRAREVESLFEIWRGHESELFDTIAGVIARNLDAFSTETIYRWIGELARLLPTADASAIFDFAGPRALARIPRPRASLPTNDASSATSVAQAMAGCFGHPRVEYRFRALYAAVELVVAYPDLAIPAFLAEAADETDARWMTRREWTLFMFHHVALRAPAVIAPYAADFAAHATSRAFPHAKCRYHARATVLAVAANDPQAVEPALLEAVRRSQQAMATVEEQYDAPGRSDEWQDAYKRPFHFNTMDTIPYWYEPLGRAFNLSAWDVAARAMEWIVTTWGITEETCDADEEADRHSYDWRDTNNRQGGEPTIETLHSYAERHGMFVAAGEMVDSLPVAQDEHSDIDEWTDWARYHVREADPALTSYLLVPPPLDLENYGVFPDGDVAAWRTNRPTAEYLRHLSAGDWFVLVAEMDATFGQHDLSVSVRSCLVQPNTADALVRAINAADEPFYPHAQKLSHDTILTEMEVDMQYDIARYGADEADEEGGKRLFRLRPTVGEHHQEFEFHSDDPRWRSFGRTYPFPSSILIGQLRLTRPDPLALVWLDDHGTIVVRAELWHDGRAGDDAEGASGYRLLVHEDALTRLLAATGEDAVFVVTMRRRLAYRYRRDEARDDYDRGTTYAIRASTLLTDD